MNAVLIGDADDAGAGTAETEATHLRVGVARPVLGDRRAHQQGHEGLKSKNVNVGRQTENCRKMISSITINSRKYLTT